MRCETCYCDLPEAKQLNPAEIIEKGSLFFGIAVKEIVSPRRDREIKDARQMLMQVMRELTNLSLTSVGKLFGRDHTTVIHSTYVVKNLCHTEPEYRQKYISLKSYVTPINNRLTEELQFIVKV